MIALREQVTEPAVGVAVSGTIDALSAIHHPGCAGAIWQRQLDPDLGAWLEGLDPDQLPRARIILPPERVRAALAQVCEISQTPKGPECRKLIDDAAALADRFSAIMKAPYLRLRFDVVTTNACRRFHVDGVTVRLICTYRGTGTQYGVQTGTEAPEPVLTVPTGAPMVLRGTLWPEDPPSGLVHRSPPIEGTGETRSVLVLDPVFDPEDEV